MGSFSSGKGVHTESGVFCSLKRPWNTFSMSPMEKAHTAEPGMLHRECHHNRPGYNPPFHLLALYFTLGLEPESNPTLYRPAHLFICVVNTPTTDGTPSMWMMSVTDWSTSK